MRESPWPCKLSISFSYIGWNHLIKHNNTDNLKITGTQRENLTIGDGTPFLCCKCPFCKDDLFEYASLNFQTSENSRESQYYYLNLRASVALLKMLTGLFLYPKRHFYLSKNNRHYLPHITKFELKKYFSFSSH